MLGGSAANVAVHTANLYRGTTTFSEEDGGEGWGGGLPAKAEAAEGSQTTCVLHTSVGSDDLGDFVRKKLDDFEVEWSQTKRRGHQVGVCFCVRGERGWSRHMYLLYLLFFLIPVDPEKKKSLVVV